MATMRIEFTIYGQPASKANSREIVPRKIRSKRTGEMITRPMSIKSDEARAFETAMLKQIPPMARQRLEGPVRVCIRIWYASERSDLDESVILDCMQDRYVTRKSKQGDVRELAHRGVYRNDRQVRLKVIVHAIDRVNPRAHIIVEPFHAQQLALALDSTIDPFEVFVP
jgi:hypothetical protein